MLFEKFEIKNFKGIREVTVDLRNRGAGLFTLIGLNESGKTTILEAIQSFDLTKSKLPSLYRNEAEGDNSDYSDVNPATFVPKRFKANFTGDVLVTATVSMTEEEREQLIDLVEQECRFVIEKSSIPLSFEIKRGYRFENSDYKEFINEFDVDLLGKSRNAKNLKHVHENERGDVWKEFGLFVKNSLPEIVYFPTFLFTQPEKIYLHYHAGETPQNALYREIISNVAKSLPQPLSIKRHIVDRILKEESLITQFFNLAFLAPDKQEQIEDTKTKISEHLTDTVFNSWSKTFGGDFTDREIRLNVNVDQVDEIVDGVSQKKPLVYAQFVIKDKSSTYQINEMSLGFRWFFSFIVFTLYKVSSGSTRPTLFLLDEPASNLHSRAQMQLLESLPRLTDNGNALIYSTHSHYMVNPDWLDQASIVSNMAIDYNDMTDSDRAKRRYTDVEIQKYRQFVGENPDKVTYFQPVLDKLNVAPSRLDLVKPSVLVEGKGDYMILEYVRKVKLGVDRSFSVVPTRGAPGMDELIGLFLGWSVPFMICLDSDRGGNDARNKYIDEWGLDPARVITLKDLSHTLENKKIEDLLNEQDVKLIKKHFGIETKPSKKQVQMFFSEMLARGENVSISKTLINRVSKFQAKGEEVLADHLKPRRKAKARKR